MKTEYRVDREEYQAGTRTERGGHRLQAALRGSVGSAPGSEGDADALRPAARYRLRVRNESGTASDIAS